MRRLPAAPLVMSRARGGKLPAPWCRPYTCTLPTIRHKAPTGRHKAPTGQDPSERSRRLVHRAAPTEMNDSSRLDGMMGAAEK